MSSREASDEACTLGCVSEAAKERRAQPKHRGGDDLNSWCVCSHAGSGATLDARRSIDEHLLTLVDHMVDHMHGDFGGPYRGPHAWGRSVASPHRILSSLWRCQLLSWCAGRDHVYSSCALDIYLHVRGDWSWWGTIVRHSHIDLNSACAPSQPRGQADTGSVCRLRPCGARHPSLFLSLRQDKNQLPIRRRATLRIWSTCRRVTLPIPPVPLASSSLNRWRTSRRTKLAYGIPAVPRERWRGCRGRTWQCPRCGGRERLPRGLSLAWTE